jgi:hypothetical protein
VSRKFQRSTGLQVICIHWPIAKDWSGSRWPPLIGDMSDFDDNALELCGAGQLFCVRTMTVERNWSG